MKNLRHRNLVEIYSIFYTDDGSQLVTLMELCSGDLLQCIERRDQIPFPYETLMDYCCQILSGLKFLHHKDIIHGGIKPQVHFD